MSTTAQPTEDEVRDEVRAWLAQNWSLSLTAREWWRRLAQSGWGYPTWPVEWFGRGLSAQLARVVMTEIRAADAVPSPHGVAQTMFAPVLLEHGTAEQKRRFLPPIAYGEELWCQFFSEPNAGSDLASLQTRAVRDGDEWLITGQKVWNSWTAWADRGVLIARTDSSLPKHKGLSFFVIDVDQPGLEVVPIKQMTGDAEFNETFFTDARVPDANLIGGLGNGWAMSIALLAAERSNWAAGPDYGEVVLAGAKPGMLDLPLEQALSTANEHSTAEGFPMGSTKRMVELARDAGRLDDLVIRQRIADLHIQVEVARLTAGRAQASTDAGRARGPESSLGYMSGVIIARRSRDLALELLGASGMLVGPDAPHEGAVADMALMSVIHGIQGGTEQIQRNIVGERVLGLPREPQTDRDIPFNELVVGTRRTA